MSAMSRRSEIGTLNRVNIMLLLDMARDGGGDRVAVGDHRSGMTYEVVHDRAGRAAAAFRAAQVDAVGYIGVTSESLPISLFGAAWAGLPFVPFNFRLAADQLRSLAGRITPALVLADEGPARIIDGVDGVQTIAITDFGAGLSDLDSGPGEWSHDGEATAVRLFTSGTTGEPKAAVLRHRHLVSYVLGSVEFMSADVDEATLVCVPPYHIAAVASVLTSVYAGRRVVQLPAFDADAWIDLANDQRITHAMVVPTMLDRIVERLDERRIGIPTLRALSCGGGKMAMATIERALDLLPSTDFVNAYGLTETSSTIALLDADDHRMAHAATSQHERRRLVSVGRPIPSVELSVRDEHGRTVEGETPGEIWVRGEQVSGEYEGRGSVLDDDGWFHTNDEGWVDADGYLFVIGRLDDVIVRGGENISPGEIEAVLCAHDDVVDAACVGTPDEEWGEIVVAAVVRRPGADATEHDLAEHVRDRLRSSKVPGRIVFVDQLQYNETGKLLRRAVRDEVTSALST